MIRFVRKCFPRCILGIAKQIVGDNTNFYFQKYLEPYKTKTVLLAIFKLHVFLFFKWLASLRFLQVPLPCTARDKGANSYGTYFIDKQ